MIGAAARVRRAFYRARLLRPEALPRPVVSVGNLTVGGAGKTPHVQFLARWLSGIGLSVAILSRGYGRRTKGVLWASGGGRAAPDAAAVGDEPALLAASLPGVAVLVGESRHEAGLACLARQHVDVFLLDDGFQHLSLARDVDLLLVDAGRPLGNGRTLPFGPLREPSSHARFADALVVSRCAGTTEGERAARAVPFPPERPTAFSRMVPRGLVDADGQPRSLPAAGTPVAAFSGLARNDQFADALAGAGLDVRAFVRFPDHHRYGPGDLRRIAAAAQDFPVVTTEKDLVRLPRLLPFPVSALRIEVAFLAGWERISELILARIGRGRG